MTGLTVLNPFFISLLPLAALPILFHLFFRLKKRPRVFPSLMFFHRIDPQLNARRRLREWLILVLRTLLILFLLLTLAHPVWLGVGKEGVIALVLILDNSGSMSGTGESSKTKLKEAVAAAHHLADQLRDKDTGGIVLFVDDPAVALPNGLVTEKADLKKALDRLTETEASGSVVRALERAFAWLENSAATRYEVHIFSDLQEEKWNQLPVELKPPRQGTSILVHRLASPSANKSNVSLTGVKLPGKAMLAGRRFPMEINLSNPTATEASVRLNWTDDAGNKNSQALAVPPRGDKNVNLVLEPPNPGLRWVNVWIDGDEFQADNRASIGYYCTEKTTVLFAGRPEEFGLLPIAISPFGDGRQSGLVTLFSEPALTMDKLRQSNSVFVVMTWESLAKLNAASGRALEQFLASGGSGLLVPNASGAALAAPSPPWLDTSLGNYEHREAGLPLVVFNPSAGVFNDLRNEKGEVALRNVKIFKYHPLRLAAKDTALAGLEDGRPLLAEHKIGRGALFVSGLAFEPGWGNLPLKPGFLALVQSMALRAGTSTSTNLVSLVAGERPTTIPDSGAALHIQTVTGSPMDWKGKPLPAFPRSGVYAVRAEGQTTYVSVRSSDKEGHQKFITTDRLPALGNLAFTVKNFSGSEALSAEYQKLGKSLDLVLPALLLAFMAFLTEGWLANPPPNKNVRRSAPKVRETGRNA